LTTFSDLVGEVRERVLLDASSTGLVDEVSPGPAAYADAVVTYLGLASSKMAAFHCVLSRWRPAEGKSAPAFGRQAIPMVWDFAEVGPFSGAGGDWQGVVEGTASALGRLRADAPGFVVQADAVSASGIDRALVSTDPPYYDNVPYADLSDFFYVWLRRTLSGAYPDLFSTVLVPKSQELVADVFRHEGRDAARDFFERGLGQLSNALEH
jgi:putative DNA methylase